MRNIQNLEEEKFYITEEKEFDRIYNIISHMPNFVIHGKSEDYYVDYFYDTPDKFLEQNRAIVRLRKYKDRSLLSIRYISSNALKEERIREAYFDMPAGVELVNHREAILFLSNKLGDVYAKILDIDTVRKLRDLRPYLVIYTDRLTYVVKNNIDVKIDVHFDRCDYQSKFTSDSDMIVKFVLENYPDSVNLDIFKRFIKQINEKVFFINDNESKYSSASRILNYSRFDDEEDDDEEDDKENDENADKE